MQSPVDEIKAKLDIADIVQEYFPLKQSGVNLKANCPFHEEKTPSFMVSREKQFYHCFGCNESGDMFEFIKKMENVEFPEALKILAKKAGVTLPEYNPEMTNLKTRLINIHEVAVSFYQDQLFNTEKGKKALEYLKEKRNLSEETIKEWQLGYAPDSWDSMVNKLRQEKFRDDEILKSGMATQKQGGSGIYDRFRDRIMFPILDYHGNVVGFTGRAMKADEPAKYLNTPQTLIYNKSEVIFGLYTAKQHIKEADSVVVVEGNMDVIASAQAGVKNVVAVSGTALTDSQIKILQRLTNNLIFCFDSDLAGRRAVERSIMLAWQQEANTKVIEINPELGKDPDDLVRKDVKIWQDLIGKAKLAMEYFFDVALREYNPNNVETKKKVAKDLLNYIIKLQNSIEQDFYIKKLAENLMVDEEVLRDTLKKAKGQKREELQKTADKSTEPLKNEMSKKDVVGERVLSILVSKADFVPYISENLMIEYLSSDLAKLYKFIIEYYTKVYDQGSNIQELLQFIEGKGPDFSAIIKKLVLLGEEEITGINDNEIMAQVKRDIFDLKKRFIKIKTIEIERELKQAEAGLQNAVSENDKHKLHNKINQLLNQFTQLSVELKETDN